MKNAEVEMCLKSNLQSRHRMCTKACPMAGRRLLFGPAQLAASFEMVRLMHAHIMKTQRGAHS